MWFVCDRAPFRQGSLMNVNAFLQVLAKLITDNALVKSVVKFVADHHPLDTLVKFVTDNPLVQSLVKFVAENPLVKSLVKFVAEDPLAYAYLGCIAAALVGFIAILFYSARTKRLLKLLKGPVPRLSDSKMLRQFEEKRTGLR